MRLTLNNSDNRKLLLSACKNGDFDLVKLLVTHGVDVSINNYGPCRYAAENGHLEIVEYLAENHSYPSDVEALSNYSLNASAQNGHLEVVKYLVTLMYSPHDKRFIDYPLQLAAQNGHLEVVKYLFSKGDDDIMIADSRALNLAIQNGHFEIVDFLWLKTPSSPSVDRYSLELAIKNGYLEIIKYITKRRRIIPTKYLNFKDYDLDVVKYLIIEEYKQLKEK